MTGVAATAALYPAARWWFMRWGADLEEIEATLPGDELVPHPTTATTRAITIDAPPEAIWPWLVQMGQDRGGLYSYDWLESMLGLHFHNADRIVPEWQHLEVGDRIRLAPPSAGPDAAFTVVAIHPPRWIVTTAGNPPIGATWVFVLHPIDAHRTRLIVRMRASLGLPALAEWFGMRVLEPVHFVMERKQLLRIKQRATRTALLT